jgi:hypothetical protein
MRPIHSRLIVVLDPWSDLLGCHIGVRADVLRPMPVGIPAWQAKRLLHGALDKAHNLRRGTRFFKLRSSKGGLGGYGRHPQYTSACRVRSRRDLTGY